MLEKSNITENRKTFVSQTTKKQNCYEPLNQKRADNTHEMRANTITIPNAIGEQLIVSIDGGESCGRHKTIIIKIHHRTEIIPIGTEYFPKFNSWATKVFLLTVTLRSIGIMQEEYNPVAVRENNAPRTVGLVSPGIPVLCVVIICSQ